MTIKTFLSFPYVQDEDSFNVYPKNKEFFFDVRYKYEDAFLNCKLRVTADKREDFCFIHLVYFYKHGQEILKEVFVENCIANFYVFQDSKTLIYNLKDINNQ